MARVTLFSFPDCHATLWAVSPKRHISHTLSWMFCSYSSLTPLPKSYALKMHKTLQCIKQNNSLNVQLPPLWCHQEMQ